MVAIVICSTSPILVCYGLESVCCIPKSGEVGGMFLVPFLALAGIAKPRDINTCEVGYRYDTP